MRDRCRSTLECQSAAAARAAASALSRKTGNVGTLAFQRTGDPDEGEFGDAEVIAQFGETPDDLSALTLVS